VKDNEAGVKMAPAFLVTDEIAPFRVARRLFGFTKSLSSRLEWRYFIGNRADHNSVNRP